MRLTATCAALTLLCATTSAAVAGQGSSLVAKAQREDQALRSNDKKLRLRHNQEALISTWQAAVKASSGGELKTAQRGEAEAWKLLAHWSGRADDQAKASAALAKLDDSSKKKKSEPRAEAKVEARVEAKVDAKKGPVMLTKVGVEGDLVLSATGEFKSERFTIPSKPGRAARIYFDLSPMIAAMEVLGAIKIERPELAKVRVGQFDNDTVRVVIDYRDEMPKVLPRIEGDRIVFAEPEIMLSAVEPKRTQKAEVVPDAVTTASVTKMLENIVAEMKSTYPIAEGHADHADDHERAEPEIEVAIAPSPVSPVVPLIEGLKKSTREALSPRSGSILQIRRVVIDAGHGGKDQGAVGAGGVEEKDVNLAIARRLGEQLEKKGLKVSYTRTTDKFLSLRDRSVIANKSGADLFISVHANAHTKKKIHGIETYYLNTTTNRYAERLARRENALDASGEDEHDPEVGMSEESGELPGGSIGQDLRLILADLAMRSATTESRRLAGLVQGSLVGTLRREHDDIKDLGVKHALFYVLLGTRMPSILIETGFVTHPTEGRRLGTSAYQDDVAKAIGQGVMRFVEERQRLAATEGGGAGPGTIDLARRSP